MLVTTFTATPIGEFPTAIVAATVFVRPEITDTFPESSFATYTTFVFESTPTPNGELPTGMVATTIFVAPDMTDTVLDWKFATYIVSVFELTPMKAGAIPTGIVAMRALVAPEITETALSALATYIVSVALSTPTKFALAPSSIVSTIVFVAGLASTPYGKEPTGIVATTVSLLPDITDSVFEKKLAAYTMFVATSTATPWGSLPTGIVAVTQVHPRTSGAPAKGACARGVTVSARSARRKTTAVAEDAFNDRFMIDQPPN